MDHTNHASNHTAPSANLNALLSENATAKQFFVSLPEAAQGRCFENAAQIHSVESLCEQAQQWRDSSGSFSHE